MGCKEWKGSGVMERKRKGWKGRLALMVMIALIVGMLPIEKTAVSRAAGGTYPDESSLEGANLNYDGLPRPAQTPSSIVEEPPGPAQTPSSIVEEPPGPAQTPSSIVVEPPGPAPSISLSDPRTNPEGVTTWDCVYFGNYWQDDTNGDGRADQNDTKKPIKWRVLSVDGDDAFLLADENLDCQKYNDTYTEVTWETCTMRSWLNGYGAGENEDGKDYSANSFLINAFSPAEQSAIQVTNVVNESSPTNPSASNKADFGNNTKDKVYVLSGEEAVAPVYGFSSDPGKEDENRRAENTEYAGAQGASIDAGTEYAGKGLWWLRSPGGGNDTASTVCYSGSVDRYGLLVIDYEVAVRPALHLNLHSNWSYAGTVTGKGQIGTVPSEPAPSPSVLETPAPAPIQTPTVLPEIPDKDPALKPNAKPDIKPIAVPGAVTPSVQVSTSFITVPAAPQASRSADSADVRVGSVASLKLKQQKQNVTVSWKKVSGAAGYQVCYSTSSRWKNKKQKMVRKNRFAVKKLKKKKTYYFRVRAYRMNGTVKKYGAWSKAYKITIKKSSV